MGSGLVQRQGSAADAIRAVAPTIIDHRGWAHEHHQMAPPVVTAACEAGAFVLAAPAEVGGWEAALPDLLLASEELGAADPTVAWHAGNSIALGYVAAYLADDDLDAVFDGRPGPYGFSAATKGRATPVDGGFLLSGTWPVLTGALDAPWAGIGGLVYDGDDVRTENGMPDVRLFVVPGAALRVSRTWDAAPTMRGTGSHAVSVSEHFVPDGLAHSWVRPRRIDRPLYRIPSSFGGPVNNAAIAIGVLRSALEHSRELVAGKASSVDGSLLRDRSRYTAAIAEADAIYRGARAALAVMAVDVWAAATKGSLSPSARAPMWSTAFWVLDTCRRALGELTIASTSGVYAGVNPTESGMRDLNAICTSMEPLRDLQEAAGRVLLGQKAGVAMF